MQVTVDGQRYGISFRHEVPPHSPLAAKLARATILAAADQDEDDFEKLNPADKLEFANLLTKIAEAIQHVLDSYDRDLSKVQTVLPHKLSPLTYHVAQLGRSAKRRRQRVTHCTIWKGERPFSAKEREPDMGAIIIGQGTAECSNLDPFVRETGRVEALHAALRNAGMANESHAAFIAAYLARPRLPKTPKQAVANG